MKILSVTSLFTLALWAAEHSYGNVYVCNSSGSERYHLSRSCRGLKACDHPIVFVSKEKARQMGKTLCKWEN